MCPPVIPSAGPLTCMCGPGMWPALISSRSATSVNAVRAYITHRGEPGLKRRLRVLHADDRFLPRRHRQLEVRIEVRRRHRQMRMHVDQPRQHRVSPSGRLHDHPLAPVSPQSPQSKRCGRPPQRSSPRPSPCRCARPAHDPRESACVLSPVRTQVAAQGKMRKPAHRKSAKVQSEKYAACHASRKEMCP